MSDALAYRRALEAVVDRFAKTGVRNRRDRDCRMIRIEPAQIGEQMRRRFDEVAARRQIEDIGAWREVAAEIEPGFARLAPRRVEPQSRPRRRTGFAPRRSRR